MTKVEKTILGNIAKMNGLCHSGTIASATGYALSTVKRYLQKLETAGTIKNTPIDGLSSWEVAE